MFLNDRKISWLVTNYTLISMETDRSNFCVNSGVCLNKKNCFCQLSKAVFVDHDMISVFDANQFTGFLFVLRVLKQKFLHKKTHL